MLLDDGSDHAAQLRQGERWTLEVIAHLARALGVDQCAGQLLERLLEEAEEPLQRRLGGRHLDRRHQDINAELVKRIDRRERNEGLLVVGQEAAHAPEDPGERRLLRERLGRDIGRHHGRQDCLYGRFAAIGSGIDVKPCDRVRFGVHQHDDTHPAGRQLPLIVEHDHLLERGGIHQHNVEQVDRRDSLARAFV